MYEMKINDHPAKNFLSYKKTHFKIKTIRIGTERRWQKTFKIRTLKNDKKKPNLQKKS